MKKIISILISAIYLSCLNTIAFADESSTNEITQTDSISSDELDQAESALDYYADNLQDKDAVSYSIKSDIEGYFDGLENYDLSKAYKSYYIDGYMIDTYKENNNFASLITDDYRIFVPTERQLVTLYPVDGKLKAIGSESIDNPDELIDFNAETERAKEQINGEIIDIIHANSFVYYLDIIYIKTTENEYVVPYFSAPLMLKEIGNRIDNGKVYKASDFMEAMDNIFDIDVIDPMAMGGVPIKPIEEVTVQNNNDDTMNNYLIIFSSIAAGVIVIGIFSVVLIVKKRKHNME
ncbi:hypothetical protein [Porcipelethomonas sp.]|uniref:hypothetical protein n=1 Tax=Porcipelethomonas sp. TaxID=2981675 RepID=UPI003076B431